VNIFNSLEAFTPLILQRIIMPMILKKYVTKMCHFLEISQGRKWMGYLRFYRNLKSIAEVGNIPGQGNSGCDLRATGFPIRSIFICFGQIPKLGVVSPSRLDYWSVNIPRAWRLKNKYYFVYSLLGTLKDTGIGLSITRLLSFSNDAPGSKWNAYRMPLKEAP
jgi:hypothetical protein